jgi:hypothetical protein
MVGVIFGFEILDFFGMNENEDDSITGKTLSNFIPFLQEI